MEIGTWYVNHELTPDEIERRTHSAQEWANSVNEVVEKTQDIEAKHLLNSVLSGIAVGLPDPERYLIPVKGPENPTIIFVPIFNSDSEINNITKMMTSPNSSQAAYYTENRPGRIYFNGEVAISSLLRGVLMLHEAKHAQFFESNQFRQGNDLDHWYEEMATFEFEFKLLQKLCGESYDEIIDKSVARFIDEYDDKDGKGVTLPQAGSLDINAIEEILGPSLSEREPALRKSIVWMNVVFRMIEAIYPDTAARDKAMFLRQIYGH